MEQRDFALKMCKKYSNAKKNNGLTKLKEQMKMHKDTCVSILNQLENNPESLKEDLEDAINIYILNGGI